MTTPIHFLRKGRKRRGKGTVLETDPTTGCVRVMANYPYTTPVWVTQAEINAAVKVEQPKAPENAESPAPPPVEWIGRVVRIHDGPGGARIHGTSILALHVVLTVSSDSAEVAMIGDNNLSVVPVSALVAATPEEIASYATQEWDRRAKVEKSRKRK